MKLCQFDYRTLSLAVFFHEIIVFVALNEWSITPLSEVIGTATKNSHCL